MGWMSEWIGMEGEECALFIALLGSLEKAEREGVGFDWKRSLRGRGRGRRVLMEEERRETGNARALVQDASLVRPGLTARGQPVLVSGAALRRGAPGSGRATARPGHDHHHRTSDVRAKHGARFFSLARAFSPSFSCAQRKGDGIGQARSVQRPGRETEREAAPLSPSILPLHFSLHFSHLPGTGCRTRRRSGWAPTCRRG